MSTTNSPIDELLQFANAKRLRIVLMKMFFESEAAGILNQDDKDDVYFLYQFLEELDE